MASTTPTRLSPLSLSTGLMLGALLLPSACFDPESEQETDDGASTSVGGGSSTGGGAPPAEDTSSDGGVDTGTTVGVTDTGDSTSTTGMSESTTGGCMDDELSCDGECIDPETDPEHCGASDDCTGQSAGVQCSPDQECIEGLCSCLEGVLCDGACIDPLTDSAFCGASDDCVDAEAGQVCGPSAACMAGACIDSCDNCGFETGDFTGWFTLDLAEPFQPLIVTEGGQIFESHTVTPTEGMYCVMNGFDGGGPGTIEVGQDIALAMEPAADLLFDYSAAWSFGGTMDRTFDVQIEPAGGGAPMETVNILTAMANSSDENTGDLQGVVDLSAYAGQTIFVRFVWSVPEFFTGPAQAQLDDVRIVAQ